MKTTVRFASLALFAACFFLLAPLAQSLAQNEDEGSANANLEEQRVAYRDAISEVLDVSRRRFMDGSDNIDGLLETMHALAQSKLAIAPNVNQRLEVLKESVAEFEKLERSQQARFEDGSGRADELAKCKAARIRAGVLLLEEQQRQIAR